MRVISAASVAAVLLWAGTMVPALLFAQEPGEGELPLERIVVSSERAVRHEAVVLVPEWSPRDRVEGERIEWRGRVVWPDGRPVVGAPVIVILNLPLAPDGVTARELDPVAIGQTNWRGELICGSCDPALSYADETPETGSFALSLRLPWAIIWPGEERIGVAGRIAIAALDDRDGALIVGITEYPISLTIGRFQRTAAWID
ncbi:MAG: hypothetical protein KatS3mg060_1153 [Dehalococcoidia bacterium]|nr:MAG: hypothetical protein KatS3mg060_1153 [Dehalococcoidia bacterium]